MINYIHLNYYGDSTFTHYTIVFWRVFFFFSPANVADTAAIAVAMLMLRIKNVKRWTKMNFLIDELMISASIYRQSASIQ